MIETAVTRVVYNGDGKTTEFPFTFPVLSKDDIVVVVADKAKKETTLTADYYVDLEGKKVIYPGYAPGEAPAESERPSVLQTGERIAIYRQTKTSQMSSLGDKFPFDVVEDALDKLTMITQEQKDQIDKVASMPITYTNTSNVSFPAPAPGYMLVWSEDGTRLENAEAPTDAVKKAEVAVAEAQAQLDKANSFADAATDAAQRAEKASENAAKFDTDNYYTKSDIDSKLQNLPSTDMSNYYTKAEVDNKFSSIVNGDEVSY